MQKPRLIVAKDFQNWKRDFLATLSNKFPDSKDASLVMKDYEAAKRLITEVGLEKVMTALNEINQNYLAKVKAERERHYEERKNMRPEDRELMQNTVQRIVKYFKDTRDYSYGRPEVYSLIQIFYQSKSLKEQIEAAKQINQYFGQNPA